MKLDPQTVRVLSRLTDRMDLIRKNPHRYDISAEDLAQIGPVAERLEAILATIKTIKAG